MDLILWRHAEAEDAASSGRDLDRRLTRKGERQAERIAEWLNRHLGESTHLLVSPALRCQQTAKALGRKFKTVPEIAPDASVEAVLTAARWPDGDEPVLIVGHQPTLGLVAAKLLCGEEQPWTIKKAGVWWLRGRGGGADGDQAVVQAVVAPDGV